MERLTRLLGLRRSSPEWENPERSIGEQRGVVRNGRYKCWEAVGPAAETWKRLFPEIKDYVQNSWHDGRALIVVEIYMIGRTEDTAAPICSADLMARRALRRAIEESGIMNSYPATGLGDTARLPDRLAQQDIEPTHLANLNPGDETIVLSSALDKAFGRRLFIPRQDGGSLRPATGGPILHMSENVYQLTVGHAFLDLEDVAPFEIQSTSLDDCDFDGQSDSDDDVSFTNLEVIDESNRISRDPQIHKNDSPTGSDIRVRAPNSSSPDPESSSSTATSQALFLSGVELSVHNGPVGNKQLRLADPASTRRLERVGKLALVSETGNKQSLDYALVGLEGLHRHGCNEVAFGPNGSQRWLRVRQAAKIGSGNVNIVTMTASSGLLSGKLCATASYMLLPNQRTLQELYSVRLDGKLAHGDCGSGVVDQLSGDFYGHIVMGNVGTGLAYIVPAMQVFQDILDRLGGDVSLMPPGLPTRSKDRTGVEPLRVVEFASKQYFQQFNQPTQSIEDGNNEKHSSPIMPFPPASIFLSPGIQMLGLQNEQTISTVLGQSQHRNGSRRPRLLGPNNRFRSRLSTLQSKASTSNVEGKGKGKEKDGMSVWSRFVSFREKFIKADVISSPAFENRFFALPSDIQVQIIASLHVPDILNLRMVSRSWHSLISVNEKPISRAFLEYNPLPHFAISLYPIPDPSEITLGYICGLWHRLFLALKLSAMMAQWIAEDVFLRITETKRLEFLPQQARMRRRLIPLLFTVIHFFENYRYLHLKRLLEHDPGLLHEACTTDSVESQIMSKYDNETLLQVHQVFPFFVLSLTRKLRPPSQFSRIERSLKGYHRDPPPAHVLVAIFCIGGLREMARFLEIEDYDTRRVAVDKWYASFSCEPTNPDSQSRRWPSWLGRKQSSLAAWSEANNSTDRTASPSGSVSPYAASGASHNDRARFSHIKNISLNATLAAGPPTGPLTAEHAQLLLPDLPELEKIWLPTAEALLLARGAVERRQDIKRHAQVMLELVREGITEADRLFYGRAVHGINREDT
jgi:hypothetical protein